MENMTTINSDPHIFVHFESSHCIAMGLDKEETVTDFTVVNFQMI